MAKSKYDAKFDVSKLDCSICLSHFRDPKLLTCFHTFCLHCLDEYVIRTGKDGKFECPLCRTSTDIPLGGVKSFQSNFYIKVEGLSEAEVDCDVCENGQKSSHYCVECEEHFCERCATAHSKMKITREHKMILLGNSSEGCIRKVQKKTFCSRHHGEEIKMICKDCDVLLCVVCKLTEHENHSTSGIAKEATERRISLPAQVAEVKNTVKSLKTIIDEIDKSTEKINKNIEMNVKEIDKCVEQIVKQIRDDADKMKQDLLKSCTDALHYYTERKKRLHEKVSEGEAVVCHTQNVIDVGSDLHLLDANLLTKLQSVKTAAANMCVKNVTPLIFQASSITRASYQLGNIIRAKSDLLPSEEITICDEEIGNTNKAHVIAVTAGHVYAGFLDFASILTYDTETNIYTQLPLSEKSRDGNVSGLAFDGEGECFFSNLYSKSVYKLTTGEVEGGRKFCKLDSFPYGLAFRYSRKNRREELLVCVLDIAYSESKISKGCVMAVPLDRKGEKYRWREEETLGPMCIAVNSTNGLVCLGYPAAGKVTLNSSDGGLLSEFTGTMDVGSPESFIPTGVCFDNEQCVIIADRGNDAVIRIDENGMYIECLIKGNMPLCVAYGLDRVLYVGFMHEDIKCYKLKIQDIL